MNRISTTSTSKPAPSASAERQAKSLSSPTSSPQYSVPAIWQRRSTRVVLSFVLIVHLLAVLAEPLCMFSRGREPAAPEAAVLRRALAPYVDFTYLNHGYFFFAPNPGPSHLLDIQLTDATGGTRQLRLPNHQAQWPRLLYHRHFMLSEFLNQLYAPPAGPVEINEMAVRAAWQRDRSIFLRVRNSMERHLAERYGAERVDIRLVEHRLPTAVEVFDARLPLNDESTYLMLSEESDAVAPTTTDSRSLDPGPPGDPQQLGIPFPRRESQAEPVPATPLPDTQRNSAQTISGSNVEKQP